MVNQGQTVGRRFIHLSWGIGIGKHFVVPICCVGKSLMNLDFMDSVFMTIYNCVEFHFGWCPCLGCPSGRALVVFPFPSEGQLTFLLCSLSSQATSVSVEARY